ncbi:hypothetical protein Bca101_002490 [Brassica carinata]
MAKAIKPVTIFVVFFLVISGAEVHETEAQDRKCLKEYGGDVGFSFCAPRIYPLFCYRRCRQNKGGAKGGKCRSEAGTGMKCLCDFCSNTP